MLGDLAHQRAPVALRHRVAWLDPPLVGEQVAEGIGVDGVPLLAGDPGSLADLATIAGHLFSGEVVGAPVTPPAGSSSASGGVRDARR